MHGSLDFSIFRGISVRIIAAKFGYGAGWKLLEFAF